MQNTYLSLLALLFDRSVGNIIRMIRVIRLPKAERGPVSWGFVGTLAVTLAYGLIMLFSASYSSGYTKYGDIYHFIKPQAIVAVVGFAAMLFLSRINYRALRYLNETFYFVTLVLLVVALFMPSDSNGCYRWVYFPGGMSLQPSEMAKFAIILGTADALDKRKDKIKNPIYGIVLPALPLIPVLILLKLEPHNSAMLLMCAIFGTMIFCAGGGGAWLFGAMGVGLAGGMAFLNHLANSESYAADRLGGVWGLTPTDTANMLWQTRQSVYAICTGGLFGVGIGNSVQKHQWLPYAENDFIGNRHHRPGGLAGVLPHRGGHGAAAKHRHQPAVFLLRRHQPAASVGRNGRHAQHFPRRQCPVSGTAETQPGRDGPQTGARTPAAGVPPAAHLIHTIEKGNVYACSDCCRRYGRPHQPCPGHCRGTEKGGTHGRNSLCRPS